MKSKYVVFGVIFCAWQQLVMVSVRMDGAALDIRALIGMTHVLSSMQWSPTLSRNSGKTSKPNTFASEDAFFLAFANSTCVEDARRN